MSRAAVDRSVAEIASMAAETAGVGPLAELIRTCTACPELVAARQNVVVGDVVADSRLLIVGEAPGANEDEVGRPFVGRGGQLLDDLLADVGIARAEVSVLNVLKCRPPSNRTPSRIEAARCTGWLDRQIVLLDPPLVLTLGRTALTWAISPKVTLNSVRGVVHDWRGRKLVASYHPSAAMRFGPNGAPRKALEADLAFVAEVLQCG
jgi:DNA polymerase